MTEFYFPPREPTLKELEKQKAKKAREDAKEEKKIDKIWNREIKKIEKENNI